VSIVAEPEAEPLDVLDDQVGAFDDARGDANAAVFMASDKARGMTGTTVNLTMGSVDDEGG
jgi:hypothetical protein